MEESKSHENQPEREVHHEAHIHREAHTHHPGHGPIPIGNNNTSWMLVSILLAVLLIVSLYMNYSLVNNVINKGTAAPSVPTAPTAAAVAPTQPTQPEAPTVVDIKLRPTDHIRGDKNAKVLIVEYSDFECPYCKRANPTVEQVSTTYGKDVALVFRHFPLSFHANAKPAAIASECAAAQGKFWEYHDILFEKSPALTADNLVQYATDLKLDVDKFKTCIKDPKTATIVDGDFAQGQSEGVQGTPAFFINGKEVSGAQPFSAFKAVIDPELA
jgi:protein-disulfide isomerase